MKMACKLTCGYMSFKEVDMTIEQFLETLGIELTDKIKEKIFDLGLATFDMVKFFSASGEEWIVLLEMHKEVENEKL